MSQDAPLESATPMRFDRANILGVGVSAIDMPLALDTIGGWIARRVPKYVCVTGVHGIIESYRSPELLEIHNRAGMVTPDGMPLVWLARMMGFREVERVYGPDLMLGVCERSIARGWRHFLYGGAPGVPELLARKLSERFAGIEIAGMYSPPFRPLSVSEDRDVVGRINDSGADIVWVGLSTPKQERWMAAHREVLNVPVLVGCGAAFDFHAGLKAQAPRWIQRSGLEWMFRLLSEPRRLGPRYLVNNPLFIGLIIRQLLRRQALPTD